MIKPHAPYTPADLKTASGVYAITCTVTARKYIGQSSDIYTRWLTHIRDLTNGKHRRKLMQADWDKYGRDTFTFTIIREVQNDNELVYQERICMLQAWESGEELYLGGRTVTTLTRVCGNESANGWLNAALSKPTD